MNRVKIGWGRAEISIDEPVQIPGQMYLRISEKIHDPLYATALCVDGGEGQDAVIFCTCDVTSISADLFDEIRAEVARQNPEVPVYNVIIGATHTHTSCFMRETPECSPDGQPIYSGLKYRAYFLRRCAEAICQAWNDRAEGGIAYGMGYAVAGQSRRTIYREDMDNIGPSPVGAPPVNGHGVMYGETNKPEFTHFEAGADHFLNAMYTFDRDNRLTGIVANVPCPSQVGEMMSFQSSDYWNEVRELAAKRFGSDVYVLPQCAAAGDLSPRVLHYKKAHWRRLMLKYGLGNDPGQAQKGTDAFYQKIMCERLEIAGRIVDGLEEVYSWASKDIQTRLCVRHERRVMQLERRRVTEEERLICEEGLKRVEAKRQSLSMDDMDAETYRLTYSRCQSALRRCNTVLERYAIQNEQPTRPVAAHVARIGEIAFCTTRFELFMDFMHRVQARSPFVQTFVIQLAGDAGLTAGGYLPTERGRANKGYSASVFDNEIGPEGGAQWVEQTLESLNQFAD